MYRAVDTGMRTIDVNTLTEAAQIMGANTFQILARIIVPNILVAVLSGAFLTFAIVIGEFTIASLLNRPAFGPYLQNIGANRAYEPSALAIIAFAITWGAMGMIHCSPASPPAPVPVRIDPMNEDFLRVDQLTKSFGANQVVKGVSFGFARGEFISLLGPSGCGKTTILRMIAGFEAPTSGTITVDGQDITHLKASQRKLGMVFQAYALFPNLNVADNIGFGLRIAGMPLEERRARVADMLRLIGLSGFEKRFPYEMSGGQQQRVALARAIAPRPRLLLLDEPLSALDAKIRVSLREEIRAIQEDLGITTVFVTHDQEKPSPSRTASW